MAVNTNTKVSIAATSTDLITVNGLCDLLQIFNNGSSTIHIDFDGGTATTSMFPIPAGSFYSRSGIDVQALRGVTITAISDSGTNANVHVVDEKIS